MRPVVVAQAKARTIGIQVKVIGLPKAPMISATAMPADIPITPPMPDTMTASERNCCKMSPWRAPGAMRIPNSPLPPATRVYSGHGPVTTIGQERATNPFVGDAA